jgi:hypothetical protein
MNLNRRELIVGAASAAAVAALPLVPAAEAGLSRMAGARRAGSDGAQSSARMPEDGRIARQRDARGISTLSSAWRAWPRLSGPFLAAPQ